jgi:hypothetical protein
MKPAARAVNFDLGAIAPPTNLCGLFTKILALPE